MNEFVIFFFVKYKLVKLWMKKSYTLLLILFFAEVSFAQNSLSDGLVAYYPFTGNSLDYSGNNNHASTNSGVSLTTDKDGNSNKAYGFNGTSSAWIDAANYSTLNTANMNNFAISVWFYPASGAAPNSDRNIVQMQDAQNRNYTITYNATTSKIDYYNWNGPLGVGNIKFSSNTNIVQNTWNHLVLRIDSNNKTELFINNIFEGFSNTVVVKPVSPVLVIGRHPIVSGTWNFLGKIDEVRVYNRYITNVNITSLFTSCNMSSTSITNTGPTTFCVGKSVMLNANLLGNTYSYTWRLNGNVISGATSSSYLALQQGTYTLRTDSSSCSSVSLPVSVIVNPIPSVSITPIPSFINLKAAPIALSGNPSGGIFTGEGVSASSLNPILSKLGAKNIKYTYVDSKGCTNAAQLTTIIYDTTICAIRDTIRTTIRDTIRTTIIDTILRYDTLRVTINKYDTIRVSVTDTLIINANLTSVNNPSIVNTIKIFPNPAMSFITIDYGSYNLMSGYQLKITNAIGQTMYSSPINQQQISLDLSSWTGKGIYYVDLFNNLGQRIDTRKIVLQ